MQTDFDISFLCQELLSKDYLPFSIQRLKKWFVVLKCQSQGKEFLAKAVPKRLYFSNFKAHQFVFNEYKVSQAVSRKCRRLLQLEDFFYTKTFMILVYKSPNMGSLARYAFCLLYTSDAADD